MSKYEGQENLTKVNTEELNRQSGERVGNSKERTEN